QQTSPSRPVRDGFLDPHSPRLSKIIIDSQSVWPPRALLAPFHVLTFDAASTFFAAQVPQVPIKVNGIEMLALVDTGAAITVCSRSITDLLGIFKLQPSPIRSAIGMAGVPVPLVGTAQGSCIPRHVDKYNIVMGNDLLSRLPSWRINYRQRSFTVGQDNIPILTCGPPHLAVDEQRGPSVVRAMQTSIIPPRSEIFIRCYVSSSRKDPLMMVAQSPALYDKHLSVTPAVFRPYYALILVADPTSRPEVLYHHQQVGAAVPLRAANSGHLVED
ncbi:hypothetical protein GCK32_021992, partial [Trichostrongylus colubriformis]